MNEYISRGDVLDIVSQYCPDDDGSCSKADVDPREMLDEIEALPTTDVQPVKHGHWDYSEKENGECAWYFCSECDEPAEQLYNNEPLLSEFCPHCGARMDGDIE